MRPFLGPLRVAATPPFAGVLPGVVSGDVERLLLGYEALVRKWAPKVNLVSLGDLACFSSKHILPALALAPVLRSLPHRRVLDVGSGSGLPGVPLAILFPQTAITLVESRRRRANFLRHVVRELALHNVSVVAHRVEAWCPPALFDVVVSRAVTDPVSLARLTAHCRAPGAFQLTTAGPAGGSEPLRVRGLRLQVDDQAAAVTAILAQP